MIARRAALEESALLRREREVDHSHAADQGQLHSMPVQAHGASKQDPDLLNPNITTADRKLMVDAADRSIQEASYESSMRLAKEKKGQEERKNTTNKFIYVTIMTASAVFSCSAIASLIVLWTFIKSRGKPQPP